MDYIDFSVEDFIQDDKFIHWVKTEEAELNAFWESWILAHPEKKEVFMEARIVLINLDFKKDQLPAREKSNLWNLLEADMTRSFPAKQVSMTNRRSWLKFAAAAIVLLLTGYGILQFQSNSEKIITTTFGEQKEVLLSDGTVVILNGNSTLKYYGNQPRKVQLEGEAYFQVAKKPKTDSDFVVTTNDLAVRVLGTVFNVNSRNESTKVFLEEGKVNLEIAEGDVNTLELAPGELVSYSRKRNKLSETKKVNAIENTSWKDGTLVFRNTPLPEVLAELSGIYGASFSLKDQILKDRLITGGVPIKNLSIALETLTGIYGIGITEENNTYIISN